MLFPVLGILDANDGPIFEKWSFKMFAISFEESVVFPRLSFIFDMLH